MLSVGVQHLVYMLQLFDLVVEVVQAVDQSTVSCAGSGVGSVKCIYPLYTCVYPWIPCVYPCILVYTLGYLVYTGVYLWIPCVYPCILVYTCVLSSLLSLDCPVADLDDYRVKVLISLRTLERLDKEPFTEDDRAAAEEEEEAQEGGNGDKG